MTPRLLVVPLLLAAFAGAARELRCEVARCSCAGGRAEDQLRNAAAAFLGEVARVIPGTQTRVGRAHFNVLRSWKGTESPVASLDLEGNLTGGPCDLSLRVGDTILVFAIRLPNGQLYTSVCGSVRGPATLRYAAQLGAYRVPRRPPQPRSSAVGDSALARQLGREAVDVARAAAVANPALTPGMIDIFQRIAHRQVELGDAAGVFAAIDASPKDAHIALSIAREYSTRDSIDRAIAVARRFLTHGELASALRTVADHASRDPALADSLRREANALVPLPSAEAAAADTASYVRVYRLMVLADQAYGTDTARADSLARVAYAIANQVAPAQRAWTRQVLTIVMDGKIGADAIPHIRMFLEQARTLDDRIEGHMRLAQHEAARDQNLTAALATIARLEAIAPPRAVAKALLELRLDAFVGNIDTAHTRRVYAVRQPLLQRAIAMSDGIDSAFADTVRSHAVAVMTSLDPWSAADVAMKIHSPQMRERAMAKVIRREIELNVSGPLDTARIVLGDALRDSLYVAIATQQAATMTIPAGLRTAARIRTRSLWAIATSEIAEVALGRADTLVSLATLREVLDLLDPKVHYATITRKALPAMLELGGDATVITWARSKTGVAGAYARLAVMAALLPCTRVWWEC